MYAIAGAMNRLFDLLVVPFGGAAGWAVVALSALCGAGLLALFKVTTRQGQLALARRRLLGLVYELGLFQEDLGVMMRVQRDLAVANARYVLLTLPALAALTLPVLLVLPQFEARFARRPLRPGEAALVTATVAPGAAARLETLRLTASPGIAVETLPVRDRAAGTAMWRVRVQAAGRHELTVHADGGPSWTKALEAGGGLPRFAAVREKPSLRAALFNPGEPPLPRDADVTAIAVEAPRRATLYAGLPLDWLVAFCLFSIAGGLALKPVLKVEI